MKQPRTRQSILNASSQFDSMEIISATVALFLEGYNATQIAKKMNERFDIGMTREDPYPIVRKAGQMGWVKYAPPMQQVHTEWLRDEFGWLSHADVVHSVESQHVAERAARLLVDLVKEHTRRKRGKPIHIGFAGGTSMRQLSRAFAELLCRHPHDLPDVIYLHALVAGFNPADPSTAPNTFFGYFLDEPLMPVKAKCVGLQAPAMVETELIERLKKTDEIQEAFKGVEDLDIIVTSGADRKDRHGSLVNCMKRSKSAMATLRKERYVADMLWRPLAEYAPIETKTDVRALTLIELSQLPEFIRNGKDVLLMLGPCGVCGEHKGRALRAILNQREKLVTHLVTDSQSCGHLYRGQHRTSAAG